MIRRGPAHDPAGAPRLYLTFDDGPDPDGTPLLLDALARHDARATFFLLGTRAAADPGLARAAVAAGHGVGNHGWTHLDAWRRRGAVADLARGEAVLEDMLGREVRDVRPPYGRLTPATLRWMRTDSRRCVLWSRMPGDFIASAPPAVLAQRLRAGARPGAIVVLHDGPPAHRAAEALNAVLPALCDAGWRFPPLPSHSGS